MSCWHLRLSSNDIPLLSRASSRIAIRSQLTARGMAALIPSSNGMAAQSIRSTSPSSTSATTRLSKFHGSSSSISVEDDGTTTMTTSAEAATAAAVTIHHQSSLDMAGVLTVEAIKTTTTILPSSSIPEQKTMMVAEEEVLPIGLIEPSYPDANVVEGEEILYHAPRITKWQPTTAGEEGKEHVRHHRRREERHRPAKVPREEKPVRYLRKAVTHFICLVLKDPNVTRKMKVVQEGIMSTFALPPKARVNVTDDLHISVLVLNLQSKEEEQYVLETLEQTKHVGPSRIRVGIESINRFRDQVLWGQPKFAEPQEFDRMSAWRLLLFERLHEFVKDGSRTWTPHATIIKTKAVPPPKPELTEEMVEWGKGVLKTTMMHDDVMTVDEEDVLEISLLSCLKAADGTYVRCGHVQFQKDSHIPYSL